MSLPSSGLPPPCQVEKVGKLHKRGAKRHNWLERTFVLKQGALCYFDGKTCKGVIPTKTFTGAKPTEDSWGSKKDRKMPCRFSLNTTERTYYFSTTTWKDMEAWVKALESWIGVDNKQTRARKQTLHADVDDIEANKPITHKCGTCGKTYQTIEDLSTHIVLRHPGADVPLPEGIKNRKICPTCGKWYEMDRDLQMHINKRHPEKTGRLDDNSTLSRNVSAPGGIKAVDLANELPDISNMSTMDIKKCQICGKLCKSDSELNEHKTKEHGGSARSTSDTDDQYGLLSLVPKPGDSKKEDDKSKNISSAEEWNAIDEIMGDMNLDDLDDL